MVLEGPPSGKVCVDSMGGHYAEIPLDADGSVTKRIRMHSHGFYALNWRACTDDGYRGAVTETFATVLDANAPFEPWGPDPETMTFEITDP